LGIAYILFLDQKHQNKNASNKVQSWANFLSLEVSYEKIRAILLKKSDEKKNRNNCKINTTFAMLESEKLLTQTRYVTA